MLKVNMLNPDSRIQEQFGCRQSDCCCDYFLCVVPASVIYGGEPGIILKTRQR
tara:strand:+ start:116 stop:274 length:159 start_codon:yes stop_codon:yes gene_type:complete